MEDRELVRLVLEFAREMNELESTFCLQDYWGQKRQQFYTRLNDIWSRYLTPRKIKNSTGAFHSPPFFRNVTEQAKIHVAETGKNRRVVEVLVAGFACDFQFTLVGRGGEWRIDSLKQRFHSVNGATDEDKWVYGRL